MIKKIIPHIAIILTLMMITLIILNYLNPFMEFLSRGMSKIVIALWITSILATIVCIALNLKNKTKTLD